MARLTIDLPDDLRPLAEARASESGHSSLESYVQSLIRVDVDVPSDDFGAPEHLSPRTSEQLEAALRVGLDGPFTPMTTDDWADLRKLASEGER